MTTGGPGRRARILDDPPAAIGCRLQMRAHPGSGARHRRRGGGNRVYPCAVTARAERAEAEPRWRRWLVSLNGRARHMRRGLCRRAGTKATW